MAPAITTDVVGTLVAVTSTPYSFKDGRTGEQKSGTSHRAWLSTSFDSAPVEVTLPPSSDLPAKFAVYSEPIRVHFRMEARGKQAGGRAEVAWHLIDFSEADQDKTLPARATKAA